MLLWPYDEAYRLRNNQRDTTHQPLSSCITFDVISSEGPARKSRGKCVIVNPASHIFYKLHYPDVVTPHFYARRVSACMQSARRLWYLMPDGRPHRLTHVPPFPRVSHKPCHRTHRPTTDMARLREPQKERRFAQLEIALIGRKPPSAASQTRRLAAIPGCCAVQTQPL